MRNKSNLAMYIRESPVIHKRAQKQNTTHTLVHTTGRLAHGAKMTD